MTGTRKVLIYGREPEAQAQLWQLRTYAKEQGWQILEEFAETVATGTKRTRPEFRRLMETIRCGEIAGGVVLAPSLSTLFDSLPQLISTIDDLRIRSVALATLVTPAEIDEGYGISVRALVQFQQGLKGSRIREGLAESRRLGKRAAGRPRVEIPLERARVLLAEGNGLRATARILGVAASTLHRKLKAVDTVQVGTQ